MGSGNVICGLGSGHPKPPTIPYLSTPSEILTVELSENLDSPPPTTHVHFIFTGVLFIVPFNVYQ